MSIPLKRSCGSVCLLNLGIRDEVRTRLEICCGSFALKKTSGLSNAPQQQQDSIYNLRYLLCVSSFPIRELVLESGSCVVGRLKEAIPCYFTLSKYRSRLKFTGSFLTLIVAMFYLE